MAQRSSGVVAVVAQTRASAKVLARTLGVESRWVFGARCARSFEGLRADLVIIDRAAVIGDDLMQTIRAAVLKTPNGQIRFASAGNVPQL